MKDYKLLFILGLLVLILPFLGVPEIYKNWVITVVALIMVGYSFYVRNELKKMNGGNEKEIFVESKGSESEEPFLDIDEEILEQAEEFEEKIMEEEND